MTSSIDLERLSLTNDLAVKYLSLPVDPHANPLCNRSSVLIALSGDPQSEFMRQEVVPCAAVIF